jgi:hypothetical protein
MGWAIFWAILYQTYLVTLALEWKFWYILWSFGILYVRSWDIWYFSGILVVIWYIFPRFGIVCQEKSGNPAFNLCLLESLTSKEDFFPFFGCSVLMSEAQP